MTAVRGAFVRKMASKVLKESRIDTPPVDLVVILRKHGIEYEEIEDFPDSVDALIIEDDAKVYAAVNSRHHLHRRRFSLPLRGAAKLASSVSQFPEFGSQIYRVAGLSIHGPLVDHSFGEFVWACAVNASLQKDFFQFG
jgi:hypothetical protein